MRERPLGYTGLETAASQERYAAESVRSPTFHCRRGTSIALRRGTNQVARARCLPSVLCLTSLPQLRTTIICDGAPARFNIRNLPSGATSQVACVEHPRYSPALTVALAPVLNWSSVVTSILITSPTGPR